jgi:hypothetical protein
VSRTAVNARGCFATVEGTNRRRRKTIGDVASLSLAKAREKARSMLRQAAEGVDPVDVQEEREEAGMFGELAALYISRTTPNLARSPGRTTSARSEWSCSRRTARTGGM